MSEVGQTQELTIEEVDSLRSRKEQRFYDWSVGVLEDAGVVGILKNDFVYHSSALHGDIDTRAGRPYSFALTKTSVEFYPGESDAAPIAFTGSSIDTDGDEIEASQVRSAFQAARRQSALIRAWKHSTSMAGMPSVQFKNLHVLPNQVAMEVETELLDFTVAVHRTATPGIFRYLLTAELPLVSSARVADAILSDVAEEAGGVPAPFSLIHSMIIAAEAVRGDPEWVAAEYPMRPRRP